MSQIKIERPHHLSPDEIRTRVEQLAGKLVAKYGGNYHWQGNRVHYSYGGGVDAWVAYSDNLVTVEVKLGMLMSAFRGMIQSEVETYLDRQIA